MTRAVFLDRDGTLIEDRGHLSSPSQVAFYPDTVDSLLRLQQYFYLFMVTHQPGIAEGWVTAANVDRVNGYVVGYLAERGVTIRETYVCPHSRTEKCRCIKPNPHFPRLAAATYNLDLPRSFTVGDHPHDVQLARKVGATGIYVLTGHGVKHRAELKEPTVVVQSIGEAADWILAACRT